MAYENRCMYCFEDLNGQNVCPHCGRDARAAVPQIQLLPGTLLYRERFLVGRAMGQDAGGIVYMAYDTKRETKLRVREYLPRESARRLNDGSVVPVAGQEEAFEKGMARLKASVEAVEDPKKRHFYFEENGTAYIAQRKSASAAGAAARAEEDAPERTARQWALIIGVAALAVLVVAFLLIRLLTNAFDTTSEPSPNPTLASDSLWAPEETPTPTPYVQTTYGAITDPELSWMDYVYGGDANQEYNNQAGSVRTATPTANPNATPRPTSQIINGNSSAREIAALQWQLIELGWLDASGASGRYDSATRQAVQDFQTYMNNTYAIDPKLTVDGIAGPATLYWLDQYAISAKPQATTPAPTLPAVVTPTPGNDSVINENSSRADIRRVQQILILLEMLPEGSDDGVYGAATRGAVWEFQDFVNRYFGSEVLAVTGEVDMATRAYMVAIANWWQDARPTATPTAQAPTVSPSPTPGVDPNSSAEMIRYMQTMLRDLGYLRNVDGDYGNATATAVRNFQIWVNQQQGFEAVSVSGVCDEATLRYLEYYANRAGQTTATATATTTPTDAPVATPTPTLEPTDAPTPSNDPGESGDDAVVVDRNSDPDSIRYMQQMLQSLGYLENVDGVYGSATTAAIVAFQNRVNQDLGYQALTPNGVFTARTAGYLEDYYENTPVVTASPEPTDPPVGEVAEPVIQFEGADSQDEGISLISGDFTIRWTAAGDVSAYRVLISDEQGTTIFDRTGAAPEGGAASLRVSANNLTPDVVYEIAITAIPAGGDEADGQTALTWVMRVDNAASPVTEPPVTEPPVTEPPVTEPPEPTVAPVSAPVISVGNTSYVEGGVSYISGDASFSWSVEGDVRGYTVTLYDAAGGVVRSGNITDNYVSVPAAMLSAGQVYTLEVAAVPAGGEAGDAVVARAQFALEAPDPTEPPATEPPEPTVAPVSAPVISVGNTSYVEGGVSYISGDASFSWSVEGDVRGYTVTLYDAAGGVVRSGNITDNYVSVPAAMLSAGQVYTLEVAAVPAGGEAGDAVVARAQFALEAPDPTEPPATEPPADPDPTQPAMPATIDQYSDAESILNMQNQLYALGMFTSDNAPARGVYDENTRWAVLRFQQSYNSQNPGAPLIEIDPADPNAVVDATTLAVLMHSAA